MDFTVKNGSSHFLRVLEAFDYYSRMQLLGFDPYDRDIVYLILEYTNVVLCNFMEGTLEVVSRKFLGPLTCQ